MNRILSSLITSAIILTGAACFQSFYRPVSDGDPNMKMVFPGQTTDAELLSLDSNKREKLLAVLNQADESQLSTLPGISTVRSRAIRDFRPFRQLDEIVSVDGVGERTFRKLISHAEASF